MEYIALGGATDDFLPDMSRLTVPYFAIHLAGGHIGLPILVLTFLLSKRVHRPPTVINFCVTWIIFSVSYCLLVYDRFYNGGRNPPFALCLAQAAMIHASPPTSVVAAMFVVLQVWRSFQSPLGSSSPSCTSRMPRYLKVFLIILPPYLVFAAISIFTIYLGLKNPETITPSIGLYCTINMDIFFAIPIICAVFMALILAFNLGMIGRFYYGWYLVRKLYPLADRRMALFIWLRVLIFNLYSFATLGACLFFVFQEDNPAPYMIQAALPLVATLVFGSQKDILQAWCFWRRSAVGHPDDDGIEDLQGNGWSSRRVNTQQSLWSATDTGRSIDESQV